MRQLLTILLLLLSMTHTAYAQEAEQTADEVTSVDTSAVDAVEVVAPAAASPSQIVYAAAAKYGVSGGLMLDIMDCESEHFTNYEGDYSHGRPTSHGPAQLHEGGLLGTFYAMGYTNPYSITESADFMAYEISIGHRSAWHC